MNNADEFLDLYKRLEQSAIRVFDFPTDGTAISRLEKLPQYKEVQQELKYCREVRALLSHNPKIEDEYTVEPSEAMITLIKKLLAEIESPETCIDRAILFDDILKAYRHYSILPVMEKMRDRGYSYIPIMQGKKVVGFFGKSTLFSYILNNPSKPITPEMTFNDIRNYISLGRKDKDTVRFIAKDTFIHEAERIVLGALRKKERVNILFITEHGKSGEDLLGMVTPWDILE